MRTIEGTSMFRDYVSEEQSVRQQNTADHATGAIDEDEYIYRDADGNEQAVQSAGEMTSTLGIFGQGDTGGVRQGAYQYARHLNADASTRYKAYQSRDMNVQGYARDANIFVSS